MPWFKKKLDFSNKSRASLVTYEVVNGVILVSVTQTKIKFHSNDKEFLKWINLGICFTNENKILNTWVFFMFRKDAFSAIPDSPRRWTKWHISFALCNAWRLRSREALPRGDRRFLTQYILRQRGWSLRRIVLLQTPKNPEKSDYIHHIPAPSTRTCLREDSVPGCFHTRGACNEAWSQRG